MIRYKKKEKNDKKFFEKQDRYIEKRQNEIKGDLESMEEKKNKISLRQFLFKIIRVFQHINTSRGREKYLSYAR